jgi:cytochrome bd-type quinol oxidase subunit 2
MGKFQISIYAISITVFVAAIWTCIFLTIKVNDQVIPTLVNGITSSISVVVGFCGVIIAIMFREIDDIKAKKFLFVAIILLLIPLTMLWSTYSFLTMNMSELAIRWSLSALISALYIFIAVVIYIVRETEKKQLTP